MDWNNDGKYDWQDTAMDMYVMDQIHNDNNAGYTPRSSSSAGSAIAIIVIWIAICVFFGILGTL